VPSPSLILTLALSQLPGPAGEQDIALLKRAPLAFLLFTPTGEGGVTGSSALIRAVNQLVEANTDLFVTQLDPSEAAECAGRLACMARKARPDYDRLQYELGNGQLAPYSEHQAYVAKKKITYPQYLLVVSNITGGERDRLGVTLLDTDAALAAAHVLDPARPGAAQELEVRLRQEAVLGEPQWGEVSGPEEAERFLASVFVNHLRRRLDDAGHWKPYGTVELITAQPGLTVTWDGEAVAVTQGAPVRLLGVRAGDHTLTLTHPELRVYETPVAVTRDGVTQLRPVLTPAVDPTAQALRRGLLYGGLGLVAAGGAVTAVALARQDASVVTYCPAFEGAAPPCSGGGFTSSGYDPARAPGFGAEVNPSGVLMAPLGYSLAATGAVWSLGTLLFGDDDHIPWLQAVAGVAAGGISYGLSHALNR
jgi:hypothetical protein